MPPKSASRKAGNEKASSETKARTDNIKANKDESESAPKRRGRPVKYPSENASSTHQYSNSTQQIVDELQDAVGEAKSTKNAPGRPKKDDAEQSKKRGRPAKTTDSTAAETVDTTKKRPGRPPKYEVDTTVKTQESKKRTRQDDTSEENVEEPPAKKRGRRPKQTDDQKKVDLKANEEEASESSAPKKRGRPAKQVDETAEPKVARKRGRPRKEVDPDVTPAVKRPRGRPRKSDVSPDGETETKPKISDRKKRDLSKAKNTAPSAENADILSLINGQVLPGLISAASSQKYWLMKAEPNSRIETTVSGNKVDIRFTIDMLESKNAPKPWDGIRNHLAQKNLKAMSVGDLCFFAESSCLTPGLVGIMKIVEKAKPDPSQFNKDSPYYDEKSTDDASRWDMVMVKLERKFKAKVPTGLLKDRSERHDDVLANMQLFRQKRLSVSKVEAHEWAFIMNIIKDVEQNPQIAKGYTSPKKSLGSLKQKDDADDTPDPERKSLGKSSVHFDDSTNEEDSTSNLISTVRKSLQGRKKTPAKSNANDAKVESDEDDDDKTPSRAKKLVSEVGDAVNQVVETVKDELHDPSTPVVSAFEAINNAISATEPSKRIGSLNPVKWINPASDAPATEPRKRGRPPKEKMENKAATTSPKKRGRPPKNQDGNSSDIPDLTLKKGSRTAKSTSTESPTNDSFDKNMTESIENGIKEVKDKVHDFTALIQSAGAALGFSQENTPHDQVGISVEEPTEENISLSSPKRSAHHEQSHDSDHEGGRDGKSILGRLGAIIASPARAVNRALSGSPERVLEKGIPSSHPSNNKKHERESGNESGSGLRGTVAEIMHLGNPDKDKLPEPEDDDDNNSGGMFHNLPTVGELMDDFLVHNRSDGGDEQ